MNDDEYVLDYKDEKQYAWQKQRIHIYSRTQRFRSVLAHLVGSQLSFRYEKDEWGLHYTDTIKPVVPARVLDLVRASINVRTCSTNRLWNNVRKILKRDGRCQKYYTHIPNIINELGGPRWRLKRDTLINVQANFVKLHAAFNRFKEKLNGRKYFPPLAYIALRLLLAEGIEMPYTIPLARTIRKRTSLNALFQQLADLTRHEDKWVTRRREWMAGKGSWGVRRQNVRGL